MSVIVPFPTLPPPSMVDESLPCDTERDLNAERQRKEELRRAACLMFTNSRLQIQQLMGTVSALLDHLPPIYVAHAKAIGALASLSLHSISKAGIADQRDAEAVQADLEAIGKVLNPLIEDMGAQLAAHFDGVDRLPFIEAVSCGLEEAAMEAGATGRRFVDQLANGEA